MCNKCLLDKHRLSPKYNIPKKVLETETLELVDIFILLESCPHQRLEAFHFSLPSSFLSSCSEHSRVRLLKEWKCWLAVSLIESQGVRKQASEGLARLSKAPGTRLRVQSLLWKTGLSARQAAKAHTFSRALKQCLKSIPIAQTTAKDWRLCSAASDISRASWLSPRSGLIRAQSATEQGGPELFSSEILEQFSIHENQRKVDLTPLACVLI